MPLFVFECQRCRNRFEDLVRPEERPDCPACGAPHPERLPPRIAVQAGSGQAGEQLGPGACGTCGDPRGPGACSLDDD